jgi:murein DD-endopeptidase MepM/ murein hydrolase activator NlpD
MARTKFGGKLAVSNRFFPRFDRYLITSRFGQRVHPITKIKKMHNGIDLTATNDGHSGHVDHICAHTGGTVDAVGYGSEVGNYVNIRVDKFTVMVYRHLRDLPTLKKGQTVKKGDIIGYMGMTGRATGAHLHWGIKRNGQWIDPEPYLDKDYPVEPAVKYC